MSLQEQGIELRLQQGDITTIKAEVVALKYAQKFHGADSGVAVALQQVGWTLEGLSPHIGEQQLVETRGGIAAPSALFVGVPSLDSFDYSEIRHFSETVLRTLAQKAPQTHHLAMTIHGVGYGLDEVEALLAQIGGYVDAIQREQFPQLLTTITIVERDLGRLQRLQAALERDIPESRFVMRTTPGNYLLRKPRLVSSLPPAATDPSRIEQAGTSAGKSPHVFVAMPFSEDFLDTFYYGIQGPIHTAGFLCERTDHDAFIGDIMERVKHMIENAAFVIADLTGANPNVFLEVGYAWGKGCPTILIAHQAQELPFDIRNHKCLKYSSIKKLEESLSKEISELKTSLHLG